MLWKLFGSEYRVNKALREKTIVYDLSPATLDIAYLAANEDMIGKAEFEKQVRSQSGK